MDNKTGKFILSLRTEKGLSQYQLAEMIPISRIGMFINKDWYEFIIEEKWMDGYGYRWARGRAKPKFYTIKRNNEIVLHTSLHQTFYKYKRDILREKEGV